eukprot:scaffold4123_cov29-Attheya_sp.AAC.2
MGFDVMFEVVPASASLIRVECQHKSPNSKTPRRRVLLRMVRKHQHVHLDCDRSEEEYVPFGQGNLTDVARGSKVSRAEDVQGHKKTRHTTYTTKLKVGMAAKSCTLRQLASTNSSMDPMAINRPALSC